MQKRNYNIKELYLLRGWTLAEIGKKYGISSERVRQVLDSEDKEQIYKHIEIRYKAKFDDTPSFKNLMQDIEEFSLKDRRKETVIKRRILVRYLYDELNIPFLQLATLLNRNHTSIMNLYYED